MATHDFVAVAVDDDHAWYADVARSLVRPSDLLAADIGCGAAEMTIALNSVLPRCAFVVGVDRDGETLDAARRHMVESGIDDGHIRLLCADLDTELTLLPAVVRGADIVWASASIHHLADQQAVLDVLATILRPGGRLALAEDGLPARHLPWDLGVGEPGLEARLLAAEERWFARMRAGLPHAVRMPYGWTIALQRAGLTGITSRAFTFDKPAPLPGADLSSVVEQLEQRVRRARADAGLSLDDARSWSRLLDPDGPAWLGRRDDIYSLRARTIHTGVRSE